jgi:hypothetical protein
MRISFLIFLLTAAALAQQAPKPATIDGTAINSITHEPLRKVELTLSTSLLTEDMEKMMEQFAGDTPKPGGPKTEHKTFTAATDSTGKFHFEVEAGDYFLKAKHVGFGDVNYKPEGKYAVAGKMHLQPGDSVTEVTIRMVPHGAINGRVIDEDGDPVGNAMVTAQTYSFEGGHRRMTPKDTAQTNGRGEFRLDKLPPGHYVVSASQMSFDMGGQTPAPPKDGSPETAYVSTYFPKVTDPSQAATINVDAGGDVPGCEIQLQKARVTRIKGKAVADDGTPLKSAQIMLMPGGNFGAMRVAMVNDPQGNFEVAHVQPGTYSVTVMQMSGASPSMHMQTVVVPNEGLKDLVLGAQKDGSVKGRVSLSGNNKVELGGMKIMLGGGGEELATMPVFGTVSKSGEFTLNKVMQQPYELETDDLPDGAYLKSVQWGGQERMGKPIDFSSGFGGSLDITLGTDGGEFQATVTRDGKPVSGATVVLLAADPDARFEATTRSDDTDASGKVTLKDVHPGSYLAFAWEQVEPGLWFDPAFIKPIEMQAASVTIQPSGHEKADLKLIPANK